MDLVRLSTAHTLSTGCNLRTSGVRRSPPCAIDPGSFSNSSVSLSVEGDISFNFLFGHDTYYTAEIGTLGTLPTKLPRNRIVSFLLWCISVKNIFIL